MPRQYTPRLERTCPQCESPFTVQPNQAARGRGKYCSDACYRAPKVTLSEYFWTRVDRSQADGCWPWTGTRNAEGYGIAAWGGRRMWRANRLSLELQGATFGPKQGALHRCDNPPCVRPDHLYVGDTKQNTIDAIVRRRLATGARNGARTRPDRVPRGDRNGARTKPERRVRGEAHHSAKLTAESVSEILRRYETGGESYQRLGIEFGVSKGTVYRVVKRKIWRHVK